MAASSVVELVIDVGCNLASLKRYPDSKIDELLQTALNFGVGGVVSITNGPKEVQRNRQLSKMFPGRIWHTIGCHPHNASESNALPLPTLLNENGCVAIGECGLDYNRMFSPKDDQLKVFGAQVELACTHSKPLYLHCRDAFDDFMQVLKDHGKPNSMPGLVHCFTGSAKEVYQFLEQGFFIGVTWSAI